MGGITNGESKEFREDKVLDKGENKNNSNIRIAMIKILELVNKGLSPLDGNTATLGRKKK